MQKKKKRVFIVIYSIDPELLLLLSFITYACESDLFPPFY